jgi:hypothetical protein
MWPDTVTKIPFIRIECSGQSLSVQGEPECLFGHQIPSANGRVDGVYAAWRWDGRKLTVQNDRYGFYPLFYSVSAGSICLSPSLPRLLMEGAPRTIDDTAMAVFLRLGFFLGDTTPFLSIRAVPPDANFEWTPAGLNIKGGVFLRKERTISREQALDGYIELFREAIRRRPPLPRTVLPLSGGRDSRHIFLELHHQGWTPSRCATVDLKYTHDAETARAWSFVYGTDCVIIPQTVPSIEAERRKNLETGLCSDEHTWFLNFADYLNNVAECAYDGIAGDNLSQSHYLTPERHTLMRGLKFEELARVLIGGNDHFVNLMLAEEIKQRWSTAAAIGAIVAELKKFQEAANPVGAFYLWNRTRREIAAYSYGLMREVRVMYAPFLDYALYDHLASLPADYLFCRTFHDETMRKAYPQAPPVPFAEGNRDSRLRRSELRAFAGNVLNLVIRRRRSEFIRADRYAVRLARSYLFDRYVDQAAWLAPPAVYLLQAEQICRGG